MVQKNSKAQHLLNFLILLWKVLVYPVIYELEILLLGPNELRWT